MLTISQSERALCFSYVISFYRIIETRVEVWENEKCCGNTSRRRVFLPRLFRVLPNFHECFCLTNRFHVAARLFSNRSQMPPTTVFVDTRLWKTKHPREMFPNFRQSYMLSTDWIEIHLSQPSSMT